ncbi:hypothetical protein HNR30_001161 [Nonomuraea soli]|uniref:Uncharacterized protein n=1 Tax=Nonomuraea soli TaxID=1032476 RepID=A0A7W0HNR8_9ACTN|nr:hypothetical protein [Nonomuraea soli]
MTPDDPERRELLLDAARHVVSDPCPSPRGLSGRLPYPWG